ncbi:MAG: hypothetical protein U0361_13140 [Nitrospiraceae bacterium]
MGAGRGQAGLRLILLRGSGAAMRLGLVTSPVTVKMPGGTLTIKVADDFALTMKGPWRKWPRGTLSPPFRRSIKLNSAPSGEVSMEKRECPVLGILCLDSRVTHDERHTPGKLEHLPAQPGVYLFKDGDHHARRQGRVAVGPRPLCSTGRRPRSGNVARYPHRPTSKPSSPAPNWKP